MREAGVIHDENPHLPALHRYAPGNLYGVASESIERARQKGTRVVIVSGGYGLLVPQEPIAYYNKRLRLSDWGRRGELLKRGLGSYVERQHHDVPIKTVYAVMSRSGDYAKLVRQMEREGRWRALGLDGQLLLPIADGGSAMREVPRAQGHLIQRLTRGELRDGAVVDNGLGFDAERLGSR